MKKILVTILTHGEHFAYFSGAWENTKNFIIPEGFEVNFVAITDSTFSIPKYLNDYIKKNNIDFRIVNIGQDVTDREQKKVETRNTYRQIAIDGNYDYLLETDGDVKPPADVLIKLLEADKDVIGGWTYNETQGGVLVFPNKIDYGEIYEGVKGNTYCLLEKRIVFANIPYSVLDGSPDDTQRQYDIRNAGYKMYVHPDVYCQHFESDYVSVPIIKTKELLLNELKLKELPENILHEALSLTKHKYIHGERETIVDDKRIEINQFGAMFSMVFKGNGKVRIYEKEPSVIDNGKWYEPLVIGKEGNFEYDVILDKKPESNVIEFDIETKDLDFFYQPFLTAEERYKMDIQCLGFRPPEVEGSYAVYHKFKKGNEFKTGKLFHIYRPKAYDLLGKEEWCELNIDKDASYLRITIPQEFLDNAIYPITIDPNFGYETAGTSGSTMISEYVVGSVFAGAVGTGSNITAYLNPSSVDITFKYALYLHSNLSLVSNGVTAQGTGVSGANWQTLNFGTSPSISAVDYVIVAWSNYPSYQICVIYYDAGDANQGHYQWELYGTFPDPLVPTHDNNKYSIYCILSGVTKGIRARIKQTGISKLIQTRARILQVSVSKKIQTKGRIEQTDISKKIQSKARLLKTLTKTITSKARVKQADISKLISSEARLLQTALSELEAQARILSTESKDLQIQARLKQTGESILSLKAKIQVALETKEIVSSAQARIIVSGMWSEIWNLTITLATISTQISFKGRIKLEGIIKTIQTKARIKLTEIEKILTERARIKQADISKKTQSKSRILTTEEALIQSRARVKTTEGKVITSRADIKKTQDGLIQSRTRVKTLNEKLLQERARIKTLEEKLITAKSRIKQADIEKTIQSQARIKITLDNILSSRADIKATIDKLLSAQAKILVLGTASQISAKARLQKFGISKAITMMAKILVLEERFIQAKAKIKRVESSLISLQARIKFTQNKTLQIRLRIAGGNFSYLRTKARIGRVGEYHLQTKARIKTLNNKLLTSRTRVKKIAEILLSVKARLFISQTKLVSAKARVQAVETKIFSAKGKIIKLEEVLLSAKARVKILSERIVSLRASIKYTQSVVLSLKASIKKTETSILSIQARINAAAISKTIQARAKLISLGQKIITSKGRIKIEGITEKITARARIKIIGIANILSALGRVLQTRTMALSSRAAVTYWFGEGLAIATEFPYQQAKEIPYPVATKFPYQQAKEVPYPIAKEATYPPPKSIY